jgi:DNA mismatch repair protein MutS
MAIITGPNMAGKSTYMRQVALNVIMAQIGSFVACKTAKIGVVDRIFTRVGASDDLVSGQSTFMVEMNEVANILNNATDKSLLILDEIGRGTSTYDGLSIAWAVIEYIHKHIRAKTLFATHFHELTELEGKLDGVKNYRITIKEKGEDIIFLRKIVKGGADKSYGIHVARLAGIPIEVIKKAQKRLKELEDNDPNNSLLKKSEETTRKDEVHTNNLGFKQGQLNLNVIREQNIIKEIRDIDINTMTPIEAINFLFNIKKKLEDF